MSLVVLRLSALVGLALLASACGNGVDGSASVAEETGSASDAETGQGRAVEAGRALLGQPAPAALLKTIDGESIDLAAAYGHRPVYLKFWATWCVPCREQMPAFEANFQRYRDQVLTVAVNSGFNDDLAAVRQYRRQHRLGMPIAIDDGRLGQALNLRVTPQHVVIGRSGRIIYVGHEEDARLQQAIEQAIAEPSSASRAAALVQGETYEVGDMVARNASLDREAGFAVGGAAADNKPRVLMFFSPWCESYLKDSRPEQAQACSRVRQQVNRLAAQGGFNILGISSGLWSTPKDLAEFRASRALHMPLHLDAGGELFRSFGVQDVPTLIVIDAEGRVAHRIGPNDKGLNVAIRAARAGR